MGVTARFLTASIPHQDIQNSIYIGNPDLKRVMFW